jgi:hypothetical protein
MTDSLTNYSLSDDSLSDDSKSEDEYMKEFQIIDEMFPNIDFTISINLDMMNDVISDEKCIVIKNTFKCYCYSLVDKKNEFFIINAPINGKITYKHLFTELMNQNCALLCDHRFIEGIHKSPNSTCQYELDIFS